MVWATFYHLIFKESSDAMKREYISEVLGKIRGVFEVPLNYYGKSSNRDGFEKVRWKL